MKHLFRIILVCTLLHTSAVAQNINTINELKEKIASSTIDSVKINLLNKLALQYSNTDSANTFNYTNQAIELSLKKKYQIGIADAYNIQGTYFQNKSQFNEALKKFESAASIFLQIKEENSYAKTINNIGRIYTLQGQPNLGITQYEKAEQLFIKTKNKEDLSVTYSNTGVAYTDKGEPGKAIEYYIKALKLEEETNSKNIGLTENNIGRLFFDTKNFSEAKIYLNKSITSCLHNNDYITAGKAQLNLGNVYITENDYTAGIKFYDEARISFEKSKFIRGVQACNNNIGAIYIRQGKYEQALSYLNDALTISKQTNSNTGTALIEQNIAFTYTLMNRFPEATEWFDKAENTATKGVDKYTRGEIYNHRSVLDSMMGNYQTALRNRSKYQAINDSLLNEKTNKQINELKTKYETEKKEHQIEILNKDNSIKSLEIQNQQLQINKQLYQLTQNKLALSQASLQIAKDSLDIKDKTETILQQQLDSTRKEEKIQVLNKQNTINQLEINNKNLEVTRKNILLFIVIILSLMSALLAYSYYKRYKLKQEAKLQEELRKKEDLATKAVLEAEENERRRIASDLHDGVGQMMSAAKMNLSAIESELSFLDEQQKKSFNKVVALIDESCKEVRSVSHNMMPNALLKSGLASAVREFIHQIDTRVLKVNLYTEGLNERIDANIETVLYRVIQECVNNVIKHAEANQLDISLIKDNDGIAATIEDNGKGFNSKDRTAFGGLGLKNIETRILFLKGTVEWDSQIGKGTLIAIHVPA